ncbi:MAG: hypothetical protein ACI9RP_002382 [Cyclobacteriaceae bacterium]
MYTSKIASELNLQVQQVAATIKLLEEGGTVPFISRYRKEMTGSMDEVQIAQVRDRLIQLKELDQRREIILKTIEEQGNLSAELKKKILAAETLPILEDLYLPYKPKRKTKATVAREKGLEPLAELIWKQSSVDVETKAEKFIDLAKGVEDVAAALQGARDIVAEKINEDAEVRAALRRIFIRDSVITSKLIKSKEKEAEKYKDYFDWSEPLSKIPSHRLLAIRRGEKEMMLSVDIAPEEGGSIQSIEKIVVTANNSASEQVKVASKDAYKRLLKPSLETEMRVMTKQKADQEAIAVFAENLKQLLLAAPLGQKSVMALDPGFRTGCKVVCLDKQGKLLHHTVIYPNEPQKQRVVSEATIRQLCQKHSIEAIVIGNGTGGRETESFAKSFSIPGNPLITMVNESGASIYSASSVAREEFPDHDVTVRGAVSIGRRIMDPLAELVKIDPKSIGVGQYQHDVDQHALKESLDDVVMSCVNNVGVELNTASKQLLTYVSGLGPQLAENIVKYREEYGPFADREALRNVPRLGDKAFEQAAAFLKIRGGKNPLDHSAVHPERYKLVGAMAKEAGCTLQDLLQEEGYRKKVDIKKYVSENVGLPTLQDIVEELAKPGRDPRQQYEVFNFQEDINEITDLKVGMKLPGIVTNLTKFGAFVDVGVHQDGLVHVSHISDQFVDDPAKKVKLQQHVQVTVLEVDVSRKRISLSMKSDPFGKPPERSKKKSNPRKEREPEGDLQAKLAMLKNKFR